MIKDRYLSDLRESGAIEQDADQVQFIYRPAYYGIFEGDMGSSKDLTEVIIAKNRGGSGFTETIEVKLTKHGFSKYEEGFENDLTEVIPPQSNTAFNPPKRNGRNSILKKTNNDRNTRRNRQKRNVPNVN